MKKNYLLSAMVLAGVAASDCWNAPVMGVQLKELRVVNPVTVSIVGDGGRYTGNVSAGLTQISVDGVVQDTFCIDVFNMSSSSLHSYDVAPLESAPVSGTLTGIAMGSAADWVERLWAKYYPTAKVNANAAAALQVAIWEVVTDTSWNLGGGHFKVSGPAAVINLAKEYLNLDTRNLGVQATDPQAHLFAYVNKSYQDYLGVPDAGATLGLMGLALCGLGVSRRRWAN